VIDEDDDVVVVVVVVVLAVVDVDRFSHEMSLTRSGINTFRMLADLYKFHQALYHQSETLGKPMEQKYVLLVNKTDLIAPDVREKRTTELLDFAFETYPNMFSSAFAISSRDGTMIPELRVRALADTIAQCGSARPLIRSCRSSWSSRRHWGRGSRRPMSCLQRR